VNCSWDGVNPQRAAEKFESLAALRSHSQPFSVARMVETRSRGLFASPWCQGNRLVRVSMGNTGTGVGKPSFLKFPGFPVGPSPFNVNGGRPIPRVVGVRVCFSELLFGAEAIRVKLYVGSAPASRH
jgi:hypothetical protein